MNGPGLVKSHIPQRKLLHCPKCRTQHIDGFDAASGINWATRQHCTHLCEGCGHEWRPFEYPTIGVRVQTVADSTLDEIRRVRDELMPMYAEIGPSGELTLMFMRTAMDRAMRALAEQDATETLRAHQELKGFK